MTFLLTVIRSELHGHPACWIRISALETTVINDEETTH